MICSTDYPSRANLPMRFRSSQVPNLTIIGVYELNPTTLLCHRNLSQGSSDTGIGYGSMEKEKRRKAKLDEGRVDAELVINELMEGIELDKHNFEEDGESSGLQLYVAKDGTVTFDKGSSRDRELKPVVVTGDSSR